MTDNNGKVKEEQLRKGNKKERKKRERVNHDIRLRKVRQVGR